MLPNARGARLARFASTAHEFLAGAAVIAVAVLWLTDWKLLAAILMLGCTLGRAALRRTERVGGSEEVLAALSAAYGRDGNREAEVPEPGDAPPGTPAMVPPQIIAAAAIAVVLIVVMLWPAPSIAPPAADAAATQPRTSTAAAKSATDGGGDWSIWPAIVAIALSELMYVGWMLEGEAIAEELVLVSRRRARRVAEFGQPRQGVPMEAALRRARHLSELLARHGVVLSPPR